jgi:hypothetical protein
MEALRTGRLPNSISRPEPESEPAAQSLREFQLLASAAYRSGRKFGCSFTVARLTPTNLLELRRRHGVAQVDRALQMASSAFARALSENEFVTVAASTLLIGFPDTGVADAAPLITQVRAAVAGAMDPQIDFDIAFKEGDEAMELLGRF